MPGSTVHRLSAARTVLTFSPTTAFLLVTRQCTESLRQPRCVTCSAEQVGRHLKALGLKRGVLTEDQTARLKELFEEHRGRRQCYQLIADGLENGCAASLSCRRLPVLSRFPSAAGPYGIACWGQHKTLTRAARPDW